MQVIADRDYAPGDQVKCQDLVGYDLKKIKWNCS